MAEIGRWNGHKFEVSSSLIRSFTGLQIKGSSETEDKEDGSQKYVSRKKGKPVEVSFTIHLNARLGCNVRTEALKFVTEARAGSKDYFYVGNKKLVTCQLMLTDATVKEIGLINKGTWTQADVQVTMKQCSKNDVGSGGGSGGGGSNKVSVKKTSTTTTKTSTLAQKIVNGVKAVATKVVNGVKKVANTVKNVLTGKTTVASAVTSAVKAGVSAVKKVATVAKAVSAIKKATTTSTAKAKITSVVNEVKSLIKKK